MCVAGCAQFERQQLSLIPMEQMPAGTESACPADPPHGPVGGSVVVTLASPPPPPPFHLSKLQGLLAPRGNLTYNKITNKYIYPCMQVAEHTREFDGLLYWSINKCPPGDHSLVS